jgi:predicted transcriptional regulator
MSQLAQEKRRPERVPLGAFVDRRQHEALAELARREDRSLSSVVRQAIGSYLERQRGDSDA